MKKINKILSFCFIFLLLFSNICMASSSTTLSIIEESSETVYLENDQGYISKSIISSDSDNGEVTIELELSNTSSDSTYSTDTEIFLVVDNSPSMDYELSSRSNKKRSCS